jgi:hypothetical protein
MLMGSIFINAGLAAGVALAAVPVILHLFMKQTPKVVMFPALRLVRERQRRSRKTLKVKNWLLLLARMALVALMALALARPRVNARVRAGAEEVETAIALVFDTSLSMGYAERDKTRLDEAKERAEEILKKAKAGSQVYVVDSSEPGKPAALSPAASRTRIAALKVRAANRSLNQAVGMGYRAVAESDRPRHEVYVFTDLTRSAWRVGDAVEGLDEAKKVPGGVDTFLVRVGPKEPHDAAIVDAEPTNGLASAGEPVPIRVRVRALGKPAQRTIELYVDGVKRDQELVDVPADSELDVRPFAVKLDAGLHRVEVRLTGEPDPLAFDDVRYLTFDVQPTLRVLIVADSAEDGFFVANALDPQVRPEGVARPFQVDQVLTAKLPPSGFGQPLGNYAGVFLLNVAKLEPGQWVALNDYVKQGGGLVVGAGDRMAANVEAYNTEARALLPAALGAVQTEPEDFTFGKADVTNALFSQDARELLSELTRVPVWKTLKAQATADARVLLSYQDDTPALLERVVQGGSAPGWVLLWTTALSRTANSLKNWNEMPAGGNWAFFVLMNQTVPYLAGTAGRKLAVEAGETVTLAVDPSKDFTDFDAVPPGEGADPITLTGPTAGGPLVIPSLTMIGPARDPTGQWKVVASKRGGERQELGFSVNPPSTEAQLTQINREELDGLFGKDGYALADDAKRLEEEVKFRDVGREIYPWLMLLILLLVTAENALANTFYREKSGGQGSATPQPARAGV